VEWCIKSKHNKAKNINKECYLEVLRRLRDAVRRKVPHLWTAGTRQLHHDNAPAHSSQLIQTFLAKHNIPVFQQAPYSPDMASCDFWLFPRLKMQLKGTRFESRDDIIRNTTAKLYSIPEMLRTMAEPLGEVFSHKETTSKGITVADLQVF
jgi:predicted N-formylglutamate amidohydrolase